MKKHQPVTVKEANTFSIIDDVEVVVNMNGIYKQVPLYRRGALLHAAVRGGFVVLKERKSTSAKTIKWDSFVCLSNEPFTYKSGDIGWLEVGDEYLKVIEAEQQPES